MIHSTAPQKRIQLAVGLLSAAIIAFQVVLMQILSIVQWYHFAYMVISVALLGFGAAGTFLSIFRKWLLEKFELVLPLLMIFSGLTMSIVIWISQLSNIRFDSYLLFADFSQIWRLLITYLTFFIPFFLGALAIGLVFVKFVNHIGKLYFANLVGSGAGGIAALGLMWLFLPQELPAIISIIPVISGIIVVPKKWKSIIPLSGTAAAISVIIITLIIINPPGLILSEFKSLSKTLNLPEAKITLERSSPYGLIQCVASPVLRYAPGLSLSYQDTVPVTKAVFNNGNWFGPVISWNRTDTTIIMDHTTNALPYSMDKRSSVLVLDAGTEIPLSGTAHALIRGAKKITVVEPNSVVLSLLKNEFAGEIDSLLHHSYVSIYNIDARTYLLTDTSKYDLITLPIISAFGGTSGLNALQEQYILTKEAFREMWLKLTPNGVISITCWMDYPVRNPLKILATIAEVLQEQGIENPTGFIAAVRSWGTITIVVKRSPISAEETHRIRDFCRQMFFDPAILSDIKPAEQAQFNVLQDDQFFTYIDEIFSSERTNLYSEYDFNIRPATDDRPYFSQFLRWKSLPNLAKRFGNRALPFFEIGYLIVAFTFVQISIAAIVLIILPLFSIGWKGGNRGEQPFTRTWVIFYFSGIGLGYMFVEIVFIQRFILYFGNPIYSAAAVISSMLICSGIGSYISSRVGSKNRPLMLLLTLSIVIVLLFLYAIILTPILQRTIALPFEVKLFLAFIFIAIPSFFMGIPFPIGIGFLAAPSTRGHSVRRNEKEVPWAWGINGCVSVISTALATIIAVEIGFVWVMVFASLAYCLPLIVNINIFRGISPIS